LIELFLRVEAAEADLNQLVNWQRPRPIDTERAFFSGIVVNHPPVLVCRNRNSAAHMYNDDP